MVRLSKGKKVEGLAEKPKRGLKFSVIYKNTVKRK
jgi:hypothetical protein